MPSPTAFITGISGQDGSWLAELLHEKGYEVHGLFRVGSNIAGDFDRSPAASFVKRHWAAIENRGAIARVIARIRPDECYHLAAQSFAGAGPAGAGPIDERTTLETNVLGTTNLLTALREHAPLCRVFFAGSSEMFGEVTTCPQTEDTPLQPVSVYGISKVAGYHLIRHFRSAHGMHASCAILYNHESERRGRQFVTRKITHAAVEILEGRQRELRLGNLDDVRDWGSAKDFVRAMWLMLQAPVPDDYVIATGTLHSVRDVVELAFTKLGLDWERYVVCDPALFRPAKPVPLAGLPAKASRQLGWRPEIDFGTIVSEMVDYDLQHARELVASR